MQEILWTFGAVLVLSLGGQAAAYVVTKLRGQSAILPSLVALAAGTMAGEALLHALPEAAEAWAGHDMRGLGIALALGFGAMMVAGAALRHRACCDPRRGGAREFAWTTSIGDCLCNFADGVAIAASYLVSLPLGLAATVAVLVHELPQEAGQCAVLLRGGLSPKRALGWNALTAATSGPVVLRM